MLGSPISSNKEHSSSNFISGKVPELSMFIVGSGDDFVLAFLVCYTDLWKL